MPTTDSFSGEAALAALAHRDLVPPTRPPQFTAGATADLRDAMARFSGPADHAGRRQSIVELVASIDLEDVARTSARIAGGMDRDVDTLRWAVPTYTLASVLGLSADREQVRADTEAIARVVGRNGPSSRESDAATERLLAACGHHADPVAAVSILYQNHDATASLIDAEVAAAFKGGGGLVGASTKRVAASSVTVGEVELAAGDEVTIDLTGMPYGSGPHQCPGQQLAEAIARGVVEALR